MKSLTPNTAPGRSIERLAYTTEEAACALGLDRTSIWRLTKRGLLRPSIALRRPLYPKSEIERFLRETVAA